MKSKVFSFLLFVLVFASGFQSKFDSLKLSRLEFHLNIPDNKLIFPGRSGLFLKNEKSYLMTHDTRLDNILIYQEKDINPISTFSLKKLDTVLGCSFGDQLVCNFIGYDSTVVFSGENIAFIINGKVKWIKSMEDVIGKDRYFIANASSNAVFDFINGNLILTFGGEYGNTDKKYKFDFKMFSLLDLEKASAKIFQFHNPDFSDNEIRMIDPITFSDNKHLYVRYGYDSNVYKIENDNSFKVYPLENKQDSFINTGNLKKDFESKLNFGNRFSDFYAFNGGFYFISKNSTNDSLIPFIYEINFLNENFKRINQLKLEQNKYLFPPTFMNQNGFALAESGWFEKEGKLVFHHYRFE